MTASVQFSYEAAPTPQKRYDTSIDDIGWQMRNMNIGREPLYASTSHQGHQQSGFHSEYIDLEALNAEVQVTSAEIGTLNENIRLLRAQQKEYNECLRSLDATIRGMERSTNSWHT